ncbi:hypothetical protein [Streptomyces sp. NBC_00503]|uniref:hypothetical protein n=1 Tax=Streptomyces sp. NBC_00503 TaxID=2903659 RepID=UPI002E80601B|nr:hypothetical protein [Streptomyces sp. NBC_00503]WUD81065.1 hypothetical protein OG490_11210 [Streptomyces sp. NBC_00503]
MTRPALRTEREAVRWTRLLLLAALLLGIVSMHTLGHPTQAHAMDDVHVMDDVPAVRIVPAAAHAPSGSAPDHTTAAHSATGVTGAAAHATAPEPAAAALPETAAAEAPRPHTGMDPMSVCLAVLGALTLLILGAGLAGPRRAAPLGGAARAPGRSGGPDPPPPRELLTLLAVQRV